MLQRQTISVRLSTLNLAAIFVAALMLGAGGFALGQLQQAPPAAASVNQGAAPGTYDPAVISGDDVQALNSFLEMDRVSPLGRTQPAVIGNDDSGALKWFLEMDRVSPLVHIQPAVIGSEHPEALKWFLEMDRVSVTP